MNESQVEFELKNLLTAVCRPQDSQSIQNATQRLKNDFYSQKDCIFPLVKIICSCKEQDVRHIAAIELRKLVLKFWEDLPLEKRQPVRNSLLEVATSNDANSETKTLKHACSRVISAIAKIELPQGQWTELAPLLLHYSQAANKADREIATYIIYTLCENADVIFSNNLIDLFYLFSRTIVDAESVEVRVNTLKAIGQAMLLIEGSDKQLIHAFHSLMPAMVEVLKDAIHRDDGSDVDAAFEVFNDLFFIESSLISKHFKELLTLMMDIAKSQNVNEEYRNSALSFISNAICYKISRIKNLKLGKYITFELMYIIKEKTTAFESTDDSDSDNPPRLALQCLDLLSRSLPASQVFEPLMQTLPTYTTDPDPQWRKAAYAAIGVALEGASEFASSKINYLLSHVLKGLHDPDESVIISALLALRQFGIEIPYYTMNQHAEFLPIIFQLLRSNNIAVSRAACSCIDSLIETFDKHIIIQYLPQLVPCLLHIASTNGISYAQKITAVAAIGSAAHAAEEQYRPYFEVTMQVIAPLLKVDSNDDSNLQELQAVTTDTLGTLSIAVGKEAFSRYMPEMTQIILMNMQKNPNRMKECTFAFFASASKPYAEDFAPFLEIIIPQIFQTLDKSDDYFDEEDNDLSSSKTIDLEAEDSDPDIDDDEFFKSINMSSALAVEKEFAAEALGDIFSNTKSAFIPYLEHTTKLLLSMLENFYGGCRKAAISSLWRNVGTLYEMSTQDGWSLDRPESLKLYHEVEALANIVRPNVIKRLNDESERSVLITDFRNINEVVRLCGPGVIEQDLQSILKVIHDVLLKKHCSQTDEFDEYQDETQNEQTSEDREGDDGFEDVDDEDDDYTDDTEEAFELIDSACSAIVALALAFGPSFASSFQVFFPYIIKEIQNKTVSMRSMVLTTISEVSEGLKEGICPMIVQIYQIIYQALVNDEDVSVRGFAAYALGVLCENTKGLSCDLNAQYAEICQRLEPLFTIQEENATNDHKNNAMGCIARMILAHPESMPLKKILPLMVNHLPLTGDYMENEPIYKMIVELYRSKNPEVLAIMQSLLPIFEQVLDNPEDQLKPETRNSVIELVRSISSPEVLAHHPNLAKFVQ